MAKLETKSLESADETRYLPKTKIEVVNFDEVTIMRATFEPGWKWSECVKPSVGTDSCDVSHINYVVSGRIKIVMNNGEEKELGPGEVAVVAPGHDAYVVGDQPCVVLDFTGGKIYGKKIF